MEIIFNNNTQELLWKIINNKNINPTKLNISKNQFANLKQTLDTGEVNDFNSLFYEFHHHHLNKKVTISKNKLKNAIIYLLAFDKKIIK